jgi:glutamine amidotransferase
MIAILDSNMGNLKSVYHGVDTMGFDCEIIESNQISEKHTHMIIPGVGNYHQVMSSNQISDIKIKVKEFADSAKPILGICLGIQLLSDFCQEGGGSEGFGLIHGEVIRMGESSSIRLPHVGWNSVHFSQDHPIFSGLKNNLDFYFVHSFHFNCKNKTNSYATTSHGNDFTSIVAEENIVGVQFHPEKSQSNGLKMLENFCSWNGKC